VARREKPVTENPVYQDLGKITGINWPKRLPYEEVIFDTSIALTRPARRRTATIFDESKGSPRMVSLWS
jgi:hypothetical protein